MNQSLHDGDMKILGRLVDASNASLLCEIQGELPIKVIYKPTAGERPLWDFPDGSLAGREVAAFHLSELLELHVVPETILREGPFGVGSVQRWIEVDAERDLGEFADSYDPHIRKIAFLDLLLNNTDRKFGHLLPMADGSIFACDHGLTFHVEDKLRTVLWQFAEDPFTSDEIKILARLSSNLDLSGFGKLISKSEINALKDRASSILEKGRFPSPTGDWPAVPWPPF